MAKKFLVGTMVKRLAIVTPKHIREGVYPVSLKQQSVSITTKSWKCLLNYCFTWFPGHSKMIMSFLLWFSYPHCNNILRRSTKFTLFCHADFSCSNNNLSLIFTDVSSLIKWYFKTCMWCVCCINIICIRKS